MYIKGYVIDSRYTLVDVLGRGSFAEVWSALDANKKEVAIKICKAALIAENDEDREKSIRRFCDEIALMKRAKSKYIVEILDYGKEKEEIPPYSCYYYIVMEKMQATLSGYLDKCRNEKKTGISVEDFLKYAIHLISGLKDLHDKGIIHRDIKPSNIFFSRDDILTIGDLGIARLSERSRATHTMFGTVGYAAPELFVNKKDASIQSDLFSMGIVFYEMLAARHPCSDTGQFYLSKETIRRLITADFYPLAEFRSDLPSSLISLIQSMSALNPDNRPKSCQNILQELQTLRQRLIEICLAQGSEYLQKKNYKQAISIFEKGLSIDAENSQVYSNIGMCYYMLNDFPRASQEFDKALQYDNEDKVVYNNRGLCRYHLNNYEESIRDFSRAIQIDPKFAEAYNNRGLAYHKLKEYYRAIQNFNRTISLTPEDPRAYNNRGLTYTEQSDYLQAISDFSKAIKLVPEDSEPYFNRGMAYLRQKNYSLAIRDLSSAIMYNPNDVLSYYQRGLAYHKLGEHSKALIDFKSARKLNPNSKNIPKYIEFCRQKIKEKKGK